MITGKIELLIFWIYLIKNHLLIRHLHTMDKQFQAKDIEASLSKFWLDNKIGSPQQKSNPSYCILFPPPNVTGNLHMGHGFLITLSDILIRYHRMLGDNTLWQMGTDHAGIATQMVVEKKLASEGIDRKTIGREAFLNHVHEWVSQVTIHDQIKRMGASVDWDTKLFTLDDTNSKLVQDVFIKLYDQGLIYRGKRLVNWDTHLQSAISDLEIENKEVNGHLYSIRYAVENSDDTLVIATTRPETLLADSAIAVHPEDERYKHLIGKKAIIPIAQRAIPIIADDYVDQSFGTGCLKITPGHDFNDYEVGKRHDLPQHNMLALDGTLNDFVPVDYQGLTAKDARKKILSALEASEDLIETKPHKHMVPFAERTGVIIEPLLTNQWFVEMTGFAKPAIDAVRNNDIELIPNNWQKTYEHFLNNLTDWCISRQLWWGHRIPAWYDESGKIYVGNNETEIRNKYTLDDSVTLTQDEDVLDTWFSSALYPLATLGFQEDPERFKTYFPTDLLITGYDILFFWVTRMIMMSLHLTGEVPFKQVFLHGLVRDEQGDKMSKSKGNVIDPLDLVDGIDLETLIQKRTYGMMQPKLAEAITKKTKKHFPNGIEAHGTDALRMCYASACTQGRDIRIHMEQLKGYKFFCNKLWNACRFLMMQTDHETQITFDIAKTNIIDQWILSEFNRHLRLATDHLNAYRFDLFTKTWYDFTWHYFCDWYLEMLKVQDNNHKQHPYACALYVMNQLLHALHPLMPFITETLWKEISTKLGLPNQGMLTQAPYPLTQDEALPVKEIDWAKSLVTQVRNIRSEGNISPDKRIDIQLSKGTELDRHNFEKAEQWIKHLCKANSISWVESPEKVSASALLETMQIDIPLKGLIDADLELKRIEKVFDKVSKDVSKLEQQLGNPNFVNHAPSHLVEEAQNNLTLNQEKLNRLNTQKNLIEKLLES